MLKIRPLPPDLAKKVREAGETPEKLARDVAIIRDWLEQEPHIIANPSDQFIVSYLRACRYSIEKFKRKFEAQMTIRCQHKSIYHNRDILSKRYQDLLNLGLIFTLPLSLTKDGPSVIYFRPGFWDPNEFQLEEIVGSMSPLFDVGMHDDDNFAIHGIIVIVDAKANMKLLCHFNPTIAMNFFNYCQKNSPFIINSIHIINMHKMIEPIYNLITTMLSSKILPKIHIHHSLDTLYEFVPQKIMVKEYGGFGPTIEESNRETVKRISDSVEILKEFDNNIIDESKRLNPIEDNENIRGTFRQLNID